MFNRLSLAAVLSVLAIGSSFAGEQLRNIAEAAPKTGRFKVPADLVWPANPGEADICLWGGDKFAAFSITIDDNCKPDHEWWLKMSDELGIKLTWFVITDRVGGRNAGFDGTWADWQKLVDAGHSVQSHTTNHNSAKNAKRELTEAELDAMYGDSLKALSDNLKNNRACCIAYPRGEPHKAVVAKYVIAARGTNGVPDTPDRVDYLCTNSGGCEAMAEMIATGKTEKGPKWLHSKSYLKRAWAVQLYHLVQHGRTDEEKATAQKKTEAELRSIASHKDRIWFGRFEDVARYGQERDTATLKVTENGADKIAFELTDRMDDNLFDYPLTVKVCLPAGWTAAKATQGGKSAAVKVVEHEGKSYALVDAVPDRGTVTIAK